MKSLIKKLFSAGGLSNTPYASENTSSTSQSPDENSEGPFDADDIEYWASLKDGSTNDNHYQKEENPAQHCAINRPDLVPSIPSCVKSDDNIVRGPQDTSRIPEIGQTSSNLQTSDFKTDPISSATVVSADVNIDLGEFHNNESADLPESVSGETHIKGSDAGSLNLTDKALDSPSPADNNEIDVDLCESDANSHKEYIDESVTSPLGEIEEGLQAFEPVDIDEPELDVCTVNEYEDPDFTGQNSHEGHLDESDNGASEPWDDIDLGGFREEHPRQDVSISGAKVSEESRAREKVLLVTQKYDCSEKVVSLLYDYVLEKGWGAALRAVEFHLERGMNDVEFELAFHLRDYWSNSTEFSATSGRHAESSLSWDLALGLVNSFSSYPEKEELEVLLSNCHERWCGSFRMRDEYFSFKDYLRDLCASKFSAYMVAPDLSMVDAGFHILHDDDFTSDGYSGKRPQVLPYERGFISTAIPQSRKKYH